MVYCNYSTSGYNFIIWKIHLPNFGEFCVILIHEWGSGNHARIIFLLFLDKCTFDSG